MNTPKQLDYAAHYPGILPGETWLRLSRAWSNTDLEQAKSTPGVRNIELFGDELTGDTLLRVYLNLMPKSDEQGVLDTLIGNLGIEWLPEEK